MAIIIKANENKLRLVNLIKIAEKEKETQCLVCSDDIGGVNNFVVDCVLDSNILNNARLRTTSYEVYEVFKTIILRQFQDEDKKKLLIVYTNHFESDLTILLNMMDRLEKEYQLAVIVTCKRYE